jgi:phosphoglycerate dehydrogenase-like enzyme
MKRYSVVFATERGQRHQRDALEAAPENLDITMLRQPDRETMLAHLPGAEFLISERTGSLDADLIRVASKLRLILRLGSLTHDIDLEAARAAGIAVCYWPVGSVIRVAEHMVLQMLALSKHLGRAEAITLAAGAEWGESKRTDEDTFAYNWSGMQNVEGLWGTTIGILGFGEIGAELARRLQGWDCQVLYNKRRRLPEYVEQELELAYVDVPTLCAQSDFIANLLPYFPETDMMLDTGFISGLKDGACLVSCGSGSVIDEKALAEAVESGKLGGAALDTFEWEPIRPDNPLIKLAMGGANVLITPHIAAGGTAAARRGRVGDYTNIVNYIEGQPLRYQVA